MATKSMSGPAKFERTGRSFVPSAGHRTDGTPSMIGELSKKPVSISAGDMAARLVDLASHPLHAVRVDVARHTYTPAEAIHSLAVDSDVRVRRAAARHPRAADVLLLLADDEDALVRYSVADNEDAPDWVLEDLCDDEDPRVRRAASRLRLDVV